MGAKADDHPLVAAWLDHHGRDDTVRQYAPFVRALLRVTKKQPQDIVQPELIALALAQNSDFRRKKAISGFGSFFRFMNERLRRPDDVSRDLTERVERAAEEQEMTKALLRAGLSAEQISSLSWRDIVAGVLVGTQPTIGSALIPKDAQTARLLGEKLLEHLQAADVDTMAGLLRSPVFDVEQTVS
jgi:hypothetical protein